MVKKLKRGKQAFIYPMSTILVGTKVDGKPNFMTVGWITRVNNKPPMVAISLAKKHLTTKSIIKTKKFSINFPTVEMAEAVDYCGIVSGMNADKAKLFNIFYKKLDVPMITECPLNIECSLVQTIELPSNYLFISEIMDSYCDENCITDHQIDIKKINPMLLTMPDNKYWSVGECIGKAWNIGKILIKV